jgi:tripeptidyl-peptidase-2
MILSPGSSSNISMAVEASMPLEITFARMWSASLSTACFVSLQFRGVLPLTTYVHLLGGQRVSEQVRLVAQLMTVNIQPSAKLDKWKSVSKPLVAGKVLPLGERDILSDGTPLYQLLLEYSFEQSETSEVVHQWPGLQGVLYESDFHGQFFMIFDNKKKLVFVGDANPKKNKLQKGKYTVRLQVRHEMVSVLERLVDLPMVSNRTLKNDIKVSAYKTKSEALIGQDSGSFGSRSLSIGTSVGIYFKEPAFDTLPKGVKNGDTFTGSITYLKKNGNSSLGADDKPSGHSFTYSVFDSTLDPGKKDETSSEDESEDKLLTVVRNAKLKYIKDLIGGAQFNDAYELLVVEYPDSIQLKVYRIRHYKKLLETAVEGERQLCVAGAKIAIDDVVAMIDVEELAKSYGVLLPLVGKEGDEKKSALVTAYSLQAKLAIEAASGSLESVENALTELKKWADITSDKFWQLTYGKLILEKK